MRSRPKSRSIKHPDGHIQRNKHTRDKNKKNMSKTKKTRNIRKAWVALLSEEQCNMTSRSEQVESFSLRVMVEMETSDTNIG